MEEASSEEKLTINFVYPKPLEELELTTLPDLTGFTKPEKLTLRNFWRNSSRNMPETIEKIYIDFFSRYEFCIEDFREKHEENKISFEALTHFVGNFFIVIGEVILKGLDAGLYMKVMLHDLIKKHLTVDVSVENMQIFVEFLENYLIEHPHHLPAPTLSLAMHKLCYLIKEGYDERNL